jgi:integrase
VVELQERALTAASFGPDEGAAATVTSRGLEPRTVKLHVSALRFFFVKTLKRPSLLDDIPYPKVPRRLPTILTVEEVARLIDAAVAPASLRSVRTRVPAASPQTVQSGDRRTSCRPPSRAGPRAAATGHQNRQHPASPHRPPYD